MAESLDREKLFSQSRYEEGVGDYLNAPFSKEEYEAFAHELVGAERVIKREFESKDLFQACQPIEEIARTGIDAPRFGALKPVGLTDPRTGRRPWAALQLRARGRPWRKLQPCRLPDQPHVSRAAACVPHDPGARERRVRALWGHAPQHLHQRAFASRLQPEVPPRD